jgi:SAM-dependent methyltransferase
MTVFAQYAKYYNLLYQDKDYAAEARFIAEQIKYHHPFANSILELGCGTGKHAALLAETGYQVHGIDRSQAMVEQAIELRQSLTPDLQKQLKFTHSDIRTFRYSETYDVVISLFHVMSYQTLNIDLTASFATAKKHLTPRGIFIFDFWYGPAVLHTPPEVRVKRLENDEIRVTRIAEPTLLPNANRVDVNYQIWIQEQQTQALAEINEVHQMRYLFQPELEFLLASEGLELLQCSEWMSDRPASLETWNVYCVARG